MNNQKLNNILKDPNTNWKYVAIVAVVGLVALSGILVYQNFWPIEQDISLIETPPIEKETPETPEQPQVMTDWKTYTNQKYGFEFGYPLSPEWKIKVDTTRQDTPLVAKLGLQECIYIILSAENPENLDVERFCEKKYENVIAEEAPFGDDVCWHVLHENPLIVNVGGKQGYRSKRVGGPLAHTATLVAANDFIFWIGKIDSDYSAYEGGCGLLNTDEIYNQILSTFKFLE